MDEERLRASFTKVKKDMEALQAEITSVKQELLEIKTYLSSLSQSSTGNEGVPADRQTDRHIPDRQTKDFKPISEFVDDLKDDLKRRFKSLTKQEFLIFATLFTVEETRKNVTYRDLAAKSGLTESSVRDYTARLISKGIPIVKEKINNKTVLLRISADLRKISTFDSLLKLRHNSL